jgi:hypothetical protein
MSEDINKLKEYYKNRSAPTQVEYDCMVHDLSLYTIPTGLKEEEFLNRLRVFFFEHPFIQAFSKRIKLRRRRTLLRKSQAVASR